MRLALFDLDHTLLTGDSDVLWCAFLMGRSVLDRASFELRNRAMERDYQAGTVSTADFCGFYISTLAGRTPAQWQILREEFLRDEVAPRIPAAARALVQRHADAGDLVVLTTATNRFITELTAQHLGIEHLIATECETGVDGCFTGRPRGTLNMREGKVTRLRTWLGERGEGKGAIASTMANATFYSDSSNDLPLLRAVGHAVAVDPDRKLQAAALDAGWPVLRLRR